MKALVAGAALLGCMGASSLASAQVLDADARDQRGGPRGRGEQIGLLVTATSFGFRLGNFSMRLAGVDAATQPELFWTVSGLSALALPVATYLLERNHPLPRGRIFAMITGGVYGYFLSLSLTMRARNEEFPSGDTLTGWQTFVGTLGGFATGYLVGALTDNRAGTGLYASTMVVTGVLTSTFLCGITRCGDSLGTFAATGATLGLVGGLALKRVLNPNLREMRFAAIGGIAGALPGLGVGLAFLLRDGTLNEDARLRVSAFSLAGLVIGGLSFWRMAQVTAPSSTPSVGASSTSSLRVMPGFDLGPGRIGLGITVM